MQDSGNQLRTFTSAREFRAWLRAVNIRGPSSSRPRDGYTRRVGTPSRCARREIPGAFIRIETPEPHPRLPEEAPSQRACLELLPGSGAVVSTHQHFLGDGGKT
jgi:hypothetical protein